MRTNAVKWLWNVTGRKKFYVFALVLMQGLNGFSGVVYALLLRNIVDSACDGNLNGFWKNVIFVSLLMLSQVAIRCVIRFLEEQARAVLENLFKGRLLHSILYKDYASVSAVHSGEWLNRLTNDCMLVANNCVEILPGMAGMAVKLVSAGAMLIILDARFCAVILPLGVVMLLTTYGFRKKLKGLHKRIQEKDGSLRIYLQECLNSMMMIRSFASEEQTERESIEKMLEHKQVRMQKNHFSNFCNACFQLAMQGMYIAGVCWCGYGILTGTISYGTLTAVTQLISQIQSPFANITGYMPKFYAMTASAERLMEIENFEDDSTGEQRSVDEIRNFYENSLKSLHMENIDFKYYPASERVGVQSKDSMPRVLKNISLEIKKGEYVAFCGHSGCGKSTVMKLLMCVYKPDSGERFMTTNSGERESLGPEWHRLFAYVPQGNQLMSGTIREVVAFADKSGMNDEERINRALKIACADEFVDKLENGVDTVLGERGTGLSEGQMQRIAVARAVFSDSPVLLLDESTSALDESTESRLLENLKKMTDKTVVIVTHRPAALRICDTIFNITESGVERKGDKNDKEGIQKKCK